VIKKNNFKLIIISIMILGVLLLLLLNGCFLLPRYGSVEGHVYVPESPTEGKSIILRDSPQAPAGYKPLVGATVGAEGSSNTTTTDIYGYFILIDISIGTIIINITPPSGSGYQPLIILPSENADYWDVTINKIDITNWPEVKVYVQVIDPINNSPIIGANDFKVDINGHEIGSLTVQSAGASASSSSSSLVIDRSGSMSGTKLSDAKDAAKTFVGFMTANDRAEVVSFASSVTVDQSFTNDKSALYNAIDNLYGTGWTALYDGIWKGLDDTNLETNERKAVIVLTDGQENWSSSEHGGGSPPDNSDVIGHAKKFNIPVYTIGLGLSKGFTVEEGVRISRGFDPAEDLEQIAEATGGEPFDTHTSTDLEHIYVQITQRMQQQYIITFTDNTGITSGILTVKVNYNQMYGEASKDYKPSEETLSAAGLAKKIVGADYLWGGKGWSIDYKAFLEPEQIKMEKYHYYYWDEDEEITKIGYGKGLDCSGLSFWSYNKAYGAIEYLGKDNPVRYEGADGQYRYNFEESITEKNLKPGDLLFFDYNNDGYKDHVAMYVGSDGSSYDVVNASSPSVGIIWSKKEDLMALEGFVGFRRLTAPRVDIEFHGGPHIDLIITEPEGLTITKDIYEIPGAFYYYVYDIDGDGKFDDTIIVPEKKIGDYLIKVVPEPGALPTDTYSLEVIANGETIILAKNVPISDVPDRPCIIRSTETTIRVIEKP
jgi:VWFA-related protein